MKSTFSAGHFFVALGVIALCSAGCTSDRLQHADMLAHTAGLRRAQVRTDTFLLTTYTKVTDPTLPFDVYIEGDGLAWLSPAEPSMNPTPRKALGLSLAALDGAANVIYIARPCQFTPHELDAQCDVSAWTDRRFSDDVVGSVNQVVDQLTGAAQNRKINLIGYSGGGTVAVLVAARRDDVVSIRTVAGNLDHAESNREHGATPLTGSLNAIDQARKLSTIPQIHFSGMDDEVISPAIARRFLVASEPTTCVTLRVMESVGHESGWVDSWQELLKDRPVCGAWGKQPIGNFQAR